MKITYDSESDILYIELRPLKDEPIRSMDGFKHDLLRGCTYEEEFRIGDIYPDHENADKNWYMTVAFEIHEASRVLGFKPGALNLEFKPPEPRPDPYAHLRGK